MNTNMLKRKDYGLGAVVVAWMFATVGALMPTVMWGFDFNQMAFTWVVLFVVILLALAVGWSPRNEPPGGKKAPTVEDHRKAGTGPFAVRKGAPASGGTTTATTAASSSGTAQASAPVTQAASGSGANTSEARKPEALSAARDGQPDDLKQLKGVGPALEKLCNSLGFYHFDQIANWTAEEVAWVDDNLEGFKGRVTRDGWVEQAKILAAGGTTEFAERVEKGDVY